MIKSSDAPCNNKNITHQATGCPCMESEEGPTGVWRSTLTLPIRPSVTRSYSRVVSSPKSLFNSCFTFFRKLGSGKPAWSMVRGRSASEETVDMLTSSSSAKRASSKLGESTWGALPPSLGSGCPHVEMKRATSLASSPSSNVFHLCRFPRVSWCRLRSWHILRPSSPPR